MKILHVETGKYMYGGARQVLYLIEGLHQRGVDNVLVCTDTSEIGRQAQAFADVHAIGMSGDLDIGFIGRLRRLIKTHQPDIVHLHSRRGADWLGGIAAKLCGVPCILSRRVDNPEGRFSMALKYRLYDKVVAISQGIGDVLLLQGLPLTKLEVIHSAVDTEVYDKSYDRNDLITNFKLPQQSLVIAVIAQLIARKGHNCVLDILPPLLQKHPHIQLLFFGQGPLQQGLQSAIDQKGLAQHVQLTGFRDDLHRFIGAIDIVAHPALMEGLGVSLLQAGAAGVAMIGSAVGGIPEIIIDQQTGLLIPPGDSQALAAAIDTLASQADLRERYGAAAKRHVQAVFSVDTMVDKNLAHYQQLLAQREMPRQ